METNQRRRKYAIISVLTHFEMFSKNNNNDNGSYLT